MKILLITAPLTQLNTPYPATAFLQGYLKANNFEVEQLDLGIELINRLFTKQSLQNIFAKVEPAQLKKASKNSKLIFKQQKEYIRTIDAVMNFLRGADPTLATQICNSNFLPQASRFKDITDLDWAFGTMGFIDRAKHLATLYIEDITDFIRETSSPYFELGKYAEHLSVYIPDFTPLEYALQLPLQMTDEIMLQILEEKIATSTPTIIGFSIPFPGNVYAILRCGQYIKQNYPSISIAWGGGYVSTELRQLNEPKVFNYTDYVLLDDGEKSLVALLTTLSKNLLLEENLIKTFIRNSNGDVVCIGKEKSSHIPFREIATPDYTGLPLDKYISLIEIANPMHKLWSDGRWNKLMLAHGCYWAKCAFCDTSLSYISKYDPAPANITVDRIENIIAQTGTSGFHFIDEAASPKILHEVSNEISRRDITISWWTNIRFEKAFTFDVCKTMSESGCIAVSGGIEVASNRVLELMNKGISIEQAAKTTYNLTQNNIMVHAYLMYGFPTQTMQETIDGLEIIRQMFAEGLIQSAFWHRYAMTIHSPSGTNPTNFGAQHLHQHTGTFANNEIDFTDNQNLNYEMLGNGLRKATHNFMNGLGFDIPVQKWFDEIVPKTTIHKNYIRSCMK
jgi:radical SAM superfamily enzyme YgiQ (UPF0313 family)